MITADSQEALKFLLNCSFGIACNANDFFQYNCAETVIIDPLDLHWVLPIVEKHKYPGIEACMAFIAGKSPIKRVLTPEFEAALLDIQNLNPEVHSEY